MALGQLQPAEYTARAAVRASPTNPEYRKLLASVLLRRRKGQAALATLGSLPAEDSRRVGDDGRRSPAGRHRRSSRSCVERTGCFRRWTG